MPNTTKIDLSEQYEALASTGQKDPAAWAKRLDDFLKARPKTPVLPLQAMTRPAMYGRD
jgi:hypothetical protein